MKNLFSFTFVAFACMLFSFSSVEASGLPGGGENEKSSKVILSASVDEIKGDFRGASENGNKVTVTCHGGDGRCFIYDNRRRILTVDPDGFEKNPYENVDKYEKISTQSVQGETVTIWEITLINPLGN